MAEAANESFLTNEVFNDVKNDFKILKLNTDQMFLILVGCLIFCKYSCLLNTLKLHTIP